MRRPLRPFYRPRPISKRMSTHNESPVLSLVSFTPRPMYSLPPHLLHSIPGPSDPSFSLRSSVVSPAAKPSADKLQWVASPHPCASPTSWTRAAVHLKHRHVQGGRRGHQAPRARRSDPHARDERYGLGPTSTPGAPDSISSPATRETISALALRFAADVPPAEFSTAGLQCYKTRPAEVVVDTSAWVAEQRAGGGRRSASSGRARGGRRCRCRGWGCKRSLGR
ncbi:hypothetical protein B0H10DRAFT_1032859 [Mycena sp. CBHHK59/15]|nr:hypothetical protein B0H10DRAFT_1032859 [Mycena sp. CBHHK59/15]